MVSADIIWVQGLWIILPQEALKLLFPVPGGLIDVLQLRHGVLGAYPAYSLFQLGSLRTFHSVSLHCSLISVLM